MLFRSEIEQMVARYEKRRTAEEQAYRALTGIRRLLAGRKPDHHLAVEYIHYVKKPLEKARALRQEIEHARAIQQTSSPTDVVEVSGELAEIH